MLYFSVKYFLLKEQMRVFFHLYKYFSFAFFDSIFFLVYLFSNPYRICRKFYEQKGGESNNVYGETPLTTLKKICHLCGIHSSDRVVELGAGRGRACFFLADIIGAEVTGVEKIAAFARRSQLVKRLLGYKNLQFCCSNFFDYDFSKVNVVYLYAPQLNDKELKKLSDSLNKLPKGAKVITISYSIYDYAPQSFQLIKYFSVSFPWGRTHAFLCTRS